MGTTRRGFFKALAGLLAGGAIGGHAAETVAAVATIDDGEPTAFPLVKTGWTVTRATDPATIGWRRHPRVYMSNSLSTWAYYEVTFGPDWETA